MIIKIKEIKNNKIVAKLEVALRRGVSTTLREGQVDVATPGGVTHILKPFDFAQHYVVINK